MKHHIQIDVAVKKARYTAFLIWRMFRHLPTKVFMRAYTALVRPVLEYCIQDLPLTTLGDKAQIENVQRMTTKIVPAKPLFLYEVRIAILGLFSMRSRRLRGDFIWVFKFLNGKFRLDPAIFFPL